MSSLNLMGLCWLLIVLLFIGGSRHYLWILGNEQTLLNSNSIWEALVLDAKDRQCFVRADEDTDMRKTTFDVKKEINREEVNIAVVVPSISRK
ncbi:hypothetical protein CQW23_17208 [Capsicum baccatum]|uniref:Uncharacterized protein n=1 Tax=Capsicum baccatum TaxID=33114 RepID=A0A2G2WD47_CAPBA|nr:hypothetical protein CQW23_17208 [Capsicum baccatum]